MKKSQMLIATMKEVPKDAEIISHQLLLKGGYVRQSGSGIYSYMTPGVIILEKIRNIVRKEMLRAGSYEILMPALQPAEL